MPVKDQAAYMREYRAKKKATQTVSIPAMLAAQGPRHFVKPTIPDLRAEVAFLTGEVARLKRALAQANRDLVLARVNKSSR